MTHRFVNLLREHWNKTSIRSKMIVLYVLIVLLPCCILMLAYYDRSTSILQNEVRESMLQTMKQAELNLSNRLNNVANVSNVLTSNPILYEYLTRYETDGNKYQEFLDYRELEQLLESLQTTPYLYRIRLFVDSELLYARERVRYFSLDEWKKDEAYEHVLESQGSIYWMDSQRMAPTDPTVPPVLTGARILRNPDRFDSIIGVLAVDIQEEVISSVLADIEFGRNERISLINGEGIVISSTDKSRIGNDLLNETRIPKEDLSEEGYLEYRSGDEAYSFMYRSIPTTGWRLVAEVPKSSMFGQSNALNRISFAVVIVVSLVIFILIMFLLFASIAEGMSARIRKLIRALKQEGLENLDETLALGSKPGDISTLEHSISRMIQTVKVLAEDSVQAKLQEREAVLKALQAQINPHFLYNTLEAINWMALRRGADDISMMIDSMSKYFRLTLNKGRDIVPVSDELMLAKAYLDIQQTRFQGSFEAFYESPDEVGDLLIPKLTLQPIVENALLHGLRSQPKREGFIKIRMWTESNGDLPELWAQVEDNGVGIPAAKLEQLFVKREAELSYGLYNVNERIRLFSGEGYGLRVESEENKGTRVTIRLKAVASSSLR